MARDNRTLGRFHLDGIIAAPRGVPQIEVTFDIDANGILHVSAKDKGTNKEQKITITASSGLNEQEIQKMVKESEANATEDKKRREEIEARNQLDTLLYSTEKMLKEHKDKLPGNEVSTLEGALAEAKKALESNSIDQIRAQTEALTKASHKLAEVVYKQTGGADAAAAAPNAEAATGSDPANNPSANGSAKSGGKGNVIDAEFDDVSK
jgi:molecular chaperone DnaK